jgi:hypothetical protein
MGTSKHVSELCTVFFTCFIIIELRPTTYLSKRCALPAIYKKRY